MYSKIKNNTKTKAISDFICRRLLFTQLFLYLCMATYRQSSVIHNTRLDYFQVKQNPQLQIFWAYLSVEHNYGGTKIQMTGQGIVTLTRTSVSVRPRTAIGKCCIFRPAFGCCALQTLVKIVIFSIFCAKKARQQIFAKNTFF